MPTFPILLSREFDFPLKGEPRTWARKAKRRTHSSVVTPPQHSSHAVHRGSEVFSSAVRWVSSPHSPSHPTPAVQLLHPPICVALDSQRRSGGGQGHGHQHARHCIGTRRASMHWHTLHPTPTPLRAWGVQRGDCERVRPCIAPPIATERRPFPRRWPRRRGRRQAAIQVAS